MREKTMKSAARGLDDTGEPVKKIRTAAASARQHRLLAPSNPTNIWRGSSLSGRSLARTGSFLARTGNRYVQDVSVQYHLALTPPARNGRLRKKRVIKHAFVPPPAGISLAFGEAGLNNLLALSPQMCVQNMGEPAGIAAL
jgi:hypothetical protein